MASGRNPPTAGGDDSKEQAAQWHAQWVDDVALFGRVLCRLALVVGADDGGRSVSLDSSALRPLGIGDASLVASGGTQ